MLEQYICEYNDENIVINEKLYSYYLDSYNEWIYDNAGNILTKKSSTETGYSSTYEYVYRRDGQLERVLFYEGERLHHYTLYTYDTQGNRTLFTMYYSDGSSEDLLQWTYDSQGNVMTFYEIEERRMTEYTYDSRGNVLTEKEVEYNKEGEERLISYREYTYDEEDHMLSEHEETYRYDEFIYYRYNMYDSHGNLIKETCCYEDGSGITIEYTYQELKLTRQQMIVFEGVMSEMMDNYFPYTIIAE